MNYRYITIIIMLGTFLYACAPKKEIRPVEQTIQEKQPAPEIRLPDIEQQKDTKGEKEKKAELLPSVSGKKTEEQYVMLNFENADIETVINTVADMLKINFILAPGVSGKITIQSHNKIPISELFQTFQTMLEFNGFTAIKEGSFYKIVPIDTAKQQPVQINTGKTLSLPKDSSFITQEIPLEYVKASDVANIVRNLMPRGTDIVVYEPSNMLIVTSSPSGMLKFLKLIEAIDIPSTERDSIKTFVYNVENGEAKKLAELLRNIYAKKTTGATPPVKSVSPTTPPTPVPTPQRPRPATGGATVQEGLAGEIEGEIVIEAYDDINALIIKTTPRGYLSLLETIKKLDVQPKQVLIEVLIAEIGLDDTTKFGLEWLLKTSVHAESRDFDVFGGFSGNPTDFIETKKDSSGNITSITTNFVPMVSSGLFANVLDPKRFNAIIYASALKDKMNILASPHILAIDNKEAKIEIAEEVPVATSITQPTAGSATTTSTSQVQFKSAGTILTVTPHINDKKQVTLKITQEVSEIGRKVPIGGQDYQGFNTRKASTTAIVQDGHTLVIGGIINERMQKTRSGIPLLSDIPVLGYLFGTTTDEVKKKELILMVTPHVVANHQEADELTKEFQEKVKGLKERLNSAKKNKEAKKD